MAGIFGWLLSWVSPGEVLRLLQEAEPRGIMMFAVLSLSSSLFRTWRYILLLNVSGHSPGRLALFLVVLVRNQFSDLLPARIGTLIYIYITTSRLGVPLAAAGSSFAVSFLFDLLAMAPLLAAAGIALGSLDGLGPGLFLGSAGLLLLVPFALLRVLAPLAHWFADLVSKSGRVSIQVYATTLRELARQVEEIRIARVQSRVFLLSILVRVTKYAALYVLLWALLAPRGFSIALLPPATVFIGVLAAESAASLPVSGLGGFGAYEGTWSLVFSLLGFPAAIARVTSIAHHLFTQLWGYGLGFGALMFLLFPVWRRVKPHFVRPVGALRFAGAIGATSGAIVMLIWGISFLPMGTARAAANAGAESPQNLRNRVALGVEFPGRIVFDSNRSRTFGIYTMRADGSDISKLVDGDLEEMLPDPSPDGRQIVFVVAKGTDRRAPKSVWIMDRDGSGTRELVSNASSPTFSADGLKVYFTRERRRAMVIDLESGTERNLFDPADFGFRGNELVSLRVSPDGRIAMFTSDRGGRWNAWGVDLTSGEAFNIGRGCEPGWESPNRFFWVRGAPALAGSGIYVFDRKRQQHEVLQDADVPRGHEYFPSFSADRKFLLYAVAPEGQHSHTIANYQIFVKNTATGEAIRVTHDQFTNRWPKHLPDTQ